MTTEKSGQTSTRKQRGRPRDWDDKKAQNTIKSLDRAMEVFEHLSLDHGKTLSVLASELGQSAATLYRVLTTLEQRGLVEFDPDAQIWSIGSKALIIGARFLRRTNIVDRARPVLRELMESTGETANLGVEKDGAVVFLSQVETHQNIRAFFAPGTRSAMHSSGIGKALLAYMDDRRFERVIGRGSLEQYTPHTITDVEIMRTEVTAIRNAGYAVDRQERDLGMCCIAAPVFDIHNEVIAGISVSGPTQRVDTDRIPMFAQRVMEAARKLSGALGADPQ